MPHTQKVMCASQKKCTSLPTVPTGATWPEIPVIPQFCDEIRARKLTVPYVSESLWRGFVFSRLATSAVTRAVNAALLLRHKVQGSAKL